MLRGLVKMGVIRIDDKLQQRIECWIKKNGNKYRFVSVKRICKQRYLRKTKKGEDGEEKT